MTRIVSFWLLVAIIVAVSLVFYQVMAGFLLPLFLATLLVVIFQPVHRWILGRCGSRRPLLAATLATIAVLACVFLPAAWIISAAASQSLALIRQIDLNGTLRQLQNVRVSLDLDVPQFEEAAELVPHFRDLETAAREQAVAAAGEADSADSLARRFEAVGQQLETLFARFPDEETDWPRPEIQPVQERLEKVRYALRAGAQAARQLPLNNDRLGSDSGDPDGQESVPSEEAAGADTTRDSTAGSGVSKESQQDERPADQPGPPNAAGPSNAAGEAGEA
ncbi:MAG: AI-2E family transporter, partial [Planctomycetota bacterium]